jgi:hypothetical protein
MEELGLDAIQFVIPAIAFDRNDPAYHLAGLHNSITCFQSIATKGKEWRAAVSPPDTNDAMGNNTLLHPIKDNVSLLDL